MKNNRTFYIDKTNKTLNLMFEFNDEIITRIKSCDYNVRWNNELKYWVIPVNAYSKSKALALIKEFDFERVEEVTEEDVVVSYKQTEVDYAYLKGLCDSRGFTYEPREYQLEALGYALEKGNIINGDDVGLGKTFESIMYAETTNSFPCLVVVPASVKYNWKEKWDEITDNKRSVAVIESSPKKSTPNRWDADVVVINYDIIGKKQGKGAAVKFEELVNNDWKMVIFDEAHFLKEKTSQRAKAAKKITKGDMKIQMLTGTAVMSRPVELWNLLVLAKREGDIASDWMQFITRYCGGYRGKFGWVTDGATNVIELNRKLREVCYIRREKRDVLQELPDITKQVIQMPISNKTKIKRAINDFIQFVKDTKGDEAAEKAQEAEHLVALGMMRKLAIEGKMKAIELYLRDWKQAEKGKLLVFGIHREPLDYLSEKFKSMLIAGGVSSIKKQEIVKEWIENDDMFLFANMQSAGTGVDGLQKVCSNMLILELPWRPSDLTQAIGRLDRSGQKSSTCVSFMLSDETIDNEMWQMLSDKEQVTEAVNKGVDIRRNKSGLKSVMRKIIKNGKKK
jgi:SWI/SNF-related matrix-associated actin-dependent regulator of chromatin subfamily A-like protein 1